MEFKDIEPEVLEIVQKARRIEMEPGEALSQIENFYGVKLGRHPGLNKVISLSDIYRKVEESGLEEKEYHRRLGILIDISELFCEERLRERYVTNYGLSGRLTAVA